MKRNSLSLVWVTTLLVPVWVSFIICVLNPKTPSDYRHIESIQKNLNYFESDVPKHATFELLMVYIVLVIAFWYRAFLTHSESNFQIDNFSRRIKSKTWIYINKVEIFILQCKIKSKALLL